MATSKGLNETSDDRLREELSTINEQETSGTINKTVQRARESIQRYLDPDSLDFMKDRETGLKEFNKFGSPEGPMIDYYVADMHPDQDKTNFCMF